MTLLTLKSNAEKLLLYFILNNAYSCRNVLQIFLNVLQDVKKMFLSTFLICLRLLGFTVDSDHLKAEEESNVIWSTVAALCQSLFRFPRPQVEQSAVCMDPQLDPLSTSF